MLKIRLSRHGRKNLPFYRIVLSEHSKPVKTGYKEVLWRFDPIKHEIKVELDIIKKWIEKWAKPSERLAKLLFINTKDKLFEKFFKHTQRHWKTKKEKKE